MPNENKSQNGLNTSLCFRDTRYRCQPVLCVLCADRFGEPYAVYIDKGGAQTPLKVLNYPHYCHISLRHSSHSLLKRHRPNYCYSQELPRAGRTNFSPMNNTMSRIWNLNLLDLTLFAMLFPVCSTSVLSASCYELCVQRCSVADSRHRF